ncbi:SDR family oxidoreductase [Streptosporangium sp. NPDC050855]|uniref:SDR family oxidoreductase n=1 Tax=Streptosporangium sp. NPDC050855 TaxID=3366194 RepID=UPI0037BC126F
MTGEVTGLFERARTAFGGVDVVVHTAGVMPLAPIADMDLNEFDRVQRTNVRGTFVVNQAAARVVRAGGSVVNFSTSVTRLQQPTYGAYAASKGAVEALTLILAREPRGRDVTVNAVAPGPTATPLFLDGKPQEVVDHLSSLAPLERLGTPDDIARSVLGLIDARWINGQVVYVNGGIA